MIFVGDDWAEAHHDVHVSDESGAKLVARRLPEGVEGVSALHQLLLSEPVEVWRGEEIVDDEALRQHRSRITHLEDELDRAVLADDLGHAERLPTELGELIDHLRSVTGLDGRPRRASDAAERARMRVSRALRRTIDRIRAADPELGDELDRTVRTRHRRSYSPDPRRPRTWSVTPDPPPH